MTLRLRYAARSDVGLLREGNEDSAYAGPRLLAVADGMGGHAHGEVASAGAIATLAPLDEDNLVTDVTAALERAVHEANEKLRRMVEKNPALEGMGTTLTALLWSGQQFGLVHVGDSRAYLLREGGLHRITRDHTLVQSLIDEGRIDEEEAAVHPQRSLLLRALEGRTEVDPDLAVFDVYAGDRYLLCSDGLSGVLSEDTLQETLRSGWDPDRVVQQLIELANRGGGPDNITCVVADVVDAGGTPDATAPSLVAGAAANAVEQRPTDDTITLETSAGRAAALMRQPPDGETSETAGTAGIADDPPPPRRWPRIFLSLLVLTVAIGGAGYAALSYTRSQYYVGARDGEVVIFRGLSQQVAGQKLSRVHRHTGLALGELPTFERGAVADNIPAESLNAAEDVVTRLRAEVQACLREQREQERREQERQQKQQRDKKNGKDQQDRQDRQKPAGPQAGGAEGSPSGTQSRPSPDPHRTPAAEGLQQGCAEGVSATGG